MVPRLHCRPLASAWRSWGDTLSPLYHGHSLSEQVALAMALAATGIPYRFLPVRYNQVNWGDMATDAAIIHFSAFDQTNAWVKREALRSYARLRRFLAQTESRFWRCYCTQMRRLLDPELDCVAVRVCDLVQDVVQEHGVDITRRS
jgi:hypothetical protein